VPAGTVWQRILSRVADVHQLAGSEGEFWLAQGALPLADGEAVAWVEMARGLLVHWVRLEPGLDPATRRVAAYRVLAPTEWNFHPHGGLAQALSALHGPEADADAQALALVYDPCVNFSVHGSGSAVCDA
jgi:Ni,Fe-hydrogenase I large subunit